MRNITFNGEKEGKFRRCRFPGIRSGHCLGTGYEASNYSITVNRVIGKYGSGLYESTVP
jgi:hypothetical protein